jgi:hypothetical protein
MPPFTSAQGVCATSACQARSFDGFNESHHANTKANPPKQIASRQPLPRAKNIALATTAAYAIALGILDLSKGKSKYKAATAHTFKNRTPTQATAGASFDHGRFELLRIVLSPLAENASGLVRFACPTREYMPKLIRESHSDMRYPP